MIQKKVRKKELMIQVKFPTMIEGKSLLSITMLKKEKNINRRLNKRKKKWLSNRENIIEKISRNNNLKFNNKKPSTDPTMWRSWRKLLRISNMILKMLKDIQPLMLWDQHSASEISLRRKTLQDSVILNFHLIQFLLVSSTGPSGSTSKNLNRFIEHQFLANISTQMISNLEAWVPLSFWAHWAV